MAVNLLEFLNEKKMEVPIDEEPVHEMHNEPPLPCGCPSSVVQDFTNGWPIGQHRLTANRGSL